MKLLLMFLCAFTFSFASVNNLLIDAAKTIDRFMAIPEEQIPPQLFKKAKAVAIVPNMIRAGFVVGARYGRGVVLFKKRDGSWSNPIFIQVYGGSLGWQIGLQSIDVVLFFMRNGFMQELANRKITLGIDLGISVGPVGRNALAATDVKLNAEVYSYSRSKGAFIGVALAGTDIELDQEYNQRFYGSNYIRQADIFQKNFNNLYLNELKRKLLEYSSW